MGKRISDGIRAWVSSRPRPLPGPEHERVMGQAKMERAGNLHALYLAGTPYEMGYQHGVLAREVIQRFREEAYAYVETLVPFPKWLARPALFYFASAYWDTMPAELCEEIRGIADGAGAHPVEVLVATAIWEMLITSGCSEFAAFAPHTPDGSMLHGYNYDLMLPEHAVIQPYLAAVFYRPEKGIPFVTVNTVGSVGVNAGFNEAGISVAWDDTHLSSRELFEGIRLPVIPFIITLRKLLQYASTVDEAVTAVRGTLPRPMADIVVIGSAGEKRAVAVETAGKRLAVREMEDGWACSTNHFRTKELAHYDQRGDWRTHPESEGWMRFPRFTAYTQLFAAHRGRLDAAAAASFLRDPYPREAVGFVHPNPAPRATICRDITSFSMIMEPEKKRIWVSDTIIPACQGSFYAFDFAGWKRLPELDLPPTGYSDALRCAELYAAGDTASARSFLDSALARDGASAPLLLMSAVLDGLKGGAAEKALREVVTRWGDSAAGRLAERWISGGAGGEPTPIAFPSAIKPVVWLKDGPGWSERAVPSQARTG
jgi:hypothetical protein